MEAALDNAYMNQVTLEAEKLGILFFRLLFGSHFNDGPINSLMFKEKQAIEEFERFVQTLVSAGVNVIPILPKLALPDAVFPNNWFSTHPSVLTFFKRADVSFVFINVNVD